MHSPIIKCFKFMNNYRITNLTISNTYKIKQKQFQSQKWGVISIIHVFECN